MENTYNNILHIVSFDTPYPPNYGGVIDVFYKIKAFKRAGAKLILHIFGQGQELLDELKEYCEQIYIYERNTGMGSQLSTIPYIVNSRRQPDLLKNLMNDDWPIVFEGLHTTYYLDHPFLKNHFKIYRESNIEHHYYWQLALASRKIIDKIFFSIEAARLYQWQNQLKYADLILTVSENDSQYLKKKFPHQQIECIPSFHGNQEVSSKIGFGDYALYHGKLSVPENDQAARFLIQKVFAELPYRFVVAGMNPEKGLIKLAQNYPNVELIANPSSQEMDKLIEEAQVNVLITQQATGLKLKLLNTLFKGRHCLVNEKMLTGTNLHPLCHIAYHKKSLKEKIIELFQIPFSADEIEKRMHHLNHFYSDDENARKILDLIFK